MPVKSFVFRFAEVEVHESEFTLTRDGQRLPVEPKAFRVLIVLLQNSGRLVSKQQLMDSVWTDAEVTEHSLTRAVALLRRLLGDDARSPRFIETVSTIGYRFLYPVDTSEKPAEGSELIHSSAALSQHSQMNPAPAEDGVVAPDIYSQETGPKSPAIRAKHRGKWMVAAAAIVIVLGAPAWYLFRPPRPLRVISMIQFTVDVGDRTLVGTDGPRIYTQSGIWRNSISTIPAAGGAVVEIPINLPNEGVRLSDVSPDGTSLLIDTYKSDIGIRTWIVRAIDGVPVRPMPAGNSHAFSPDGEFVAYIHDGGMWVVGTDGTGAHKIAKTEPGYSAFSSFNITWSPDGKRIRFNQGLRGWRLWEVGSDGSNPHQPPLDTRDSYWQCCGRWTADGHFYVFLDQTKESVGGEVWALDERRGLLRRPSVFPQRLVSGPTRWVRILPAKDANTLYADGVETRGQLVRLDKRAGQFRPFLSGMSVRDVNFSPDGRFIVYVTYPDGLLFRAKADGSNPVQLTGWGYFPIRPTWSPDGTQILFGTTYPGGAFVVPASGGMPQPVLPDDRRPALDATWSADGKKIALSARLSEVPKSSIRVVDLATNIASDLPGSTGMSSPRWSPDGRYIATETFDSQGLDRRGLNVLDTTTQKWTTILENLHVYMLDWSRNGKWIYVVISGSDQKYSLVRVRFPGGRRESVTPLDTKERLFWFGLDPSDSVLSTRDVGRHQFYTLTLSQK